MPGGSGEVECKECLTKNKAGAIMCENCGVPLEVSVAAIGPVKAVSSVSSAGVIGRACALVEAGKVGTREFELPPDDFEFSIGRTDLDQGIIPDVDLTKFAEKVTVKGDVGYTVSRKQAIISRRMGKLFLKDLGGAKTLVKPVKEDWKQLTKDQETELQVGDRFRFGGSEGYVIFEVV